MKTKTLVVTAVAGVGLLASGILIQGAMNRAANRPTNVAMNHSMHQEGQQAGQQGEMMHGMQVNSELEYLSEMIPHHQEAIDGAKLILERSDRPEMKQFAQDIIEVQTREINQMQTWLKDWYPGQSASPTYSPMMRDMAQLQGDALDRAFLEDMVMHHEGAVMMSQMLLNRNLVEHQAVRPFAEAIATTQQQEISQMQTWLKSWFGVAETMPEMHHGMH